MKRDLVVVGKVTNMNRRQAATFNGYDVCSSCSQVSRSMSFYLVAVVIIVLNGGWAVGVSEKDRPPYINRP